MVGIIHALPKWSFKLKCVWDTPLYVKSVAGGGNPIQSGVKFPPEYTLNNIDKDNNNGDKGAQISVQKMKKV